MVAVPPVSAYTDEQRAAIQSRTIKVLLCSQASGGVGLVATYIVSALLAKDITGSPTLATIAAACLSIGAAVVAVPLSRLMSTRGRRVGLRMAYIVGASGAACAVLAAVLRNYPLLCIGVLGAGAGNAANLSTRYAASDLAPESVRARTISIIVWATTIGSTTGSLTSGWASDVGVRLGLPDKAGSYLLSGVMFLVAAAIVDFFLRPDPLEVAGGLGVSEDKDDRPSPREAIALVWAKPAARLAVLAMIVSQVTMVGVMALTPLHMDEGGQTQAAIGAMMALHILGMYFFSPIVGWLTDRIGRYPMLITAGVLCTWGAWWAAVTPPVGRMGVFMGNFLIGLGWCFGVIAASSLMVSLYPIHQRVAVQGIGDFAMIGSGAIAGLSSGALYTVFEYRGVNYANAGFGVLLIVAVLVTMLVTRGHAGASSDVEDPTSPPDRPTDARSDAEQAAVVPEVPEPELGLVAAEPRVALASAEQIGRAFLLAQKAADDALAAAEAEGAEVIARASVAAEGLLAEARREADEIRAAATAEGREAVRGRQAEVDRLLLDAQRLLDEAARDAEATVAAARSEAAALVESARGSVAADLDLRRGQLSDELAELEATVAARRAEARDLTELVAGRRDKLAGLVRELGGVSQRLDALDGDAARVQVSEQHRLINLAATDERTAEPAAPAGKASRVGIANGERPRWAAIEASGGEPASIEEAGPVEVADIDDPFLADLRHHESPERDDEVAKRPRVRRI